MDDHDLAAQLLQDHFTPTAARIAVILMGLPDDIRTRTLDAVRACSQLELGTRFVA